MNKGRPPGWIRRLGRVVLRHRRDVVLAFAAAVLGSACQVVVPLVGRHIVDRVILHHESALWPWLLFLLALAAASFGFAYIRRYRGGRVALLVQNDLRNAMHDHLQQLDFATLNRIPTGQLVARVNSDSALVQGLLSFLPIMSGNVLMMFLSLGVMFALSPPLALVAAVVAPLLLVVSYRMRWRVFPATWHAQQLEGDLAQIVDEDVNGVRIVKAFGQEEREVDRLVGSALRLYGSQMRAVRLQSRYQPLLEAIPSFAQAAVLALGGWLVLHDHISLGTFLAFSTYVTQLLAPARQLAGVLTVGQQARAGVERIFEILELEPAIADAPDAVDLGGIEGDVVFDDVHVSHDGSPILRGFDLHVRAGERVAIIGASGSGKSTVALLVPRFLDPEQGSVRVDGHDVRGVALGSLRRDVGVLFDESFLFSDSIRANIAYGRPDATDDEVTAAARAAQAHGFIEELPYGYDTVVGERGLTLSGGQRQRIALARAILYAPKVLILDDATSAVDAATEAAIHDTLREQLASRTTILIAHRASTVHLADRVVVMEAGRVVEEGAHDELVERSARYRALLTGFEDAEAEAVGDQVEMLATLATTPSAWDRATPVATGVLSAARNVGPPSLGAGLGGGGGSSWRLALAPTPELMDRVAALRPIRDDVELDLPAETRHQREMSLKTLLREFRRPLLFGLLFVVLDGIASMAGPVLVKIGIDDGVAEGSQHVLFLAAAVLVAVVLLDLVDQVAETFVTGRAAQRIMLSLRVRIWAQLQRLSLDYYEREMAGRIMTRMTTDVDQFESLVENGLLAALVSAVTFVGVGVALVVLDAELGLWTLSVTIPLAMATVLFRRYASRLYDISRDRIAIVNADFQESLSGVRESQTFRHEAATIERFHDLGRQYLESRVAAQRLVATYFPFVQFLSACADAIVLGVGARLVGGGSLTTGELIAFLLYIDMFFSPIQQLSQVFDAWQQTRVSVSRISELMGIDTLTPPPVEPIDPGHVRGELELSHVRFTYPVAPRRSLESDGDAAPVRPPEALCGIDLTIAAGETVALVGETGAGKSTVVKLLLRFYDPTEGAVRIDGHDLRTIDLDVLRHQVGYVPQEPFLFTGTVRDNIAYGRPDATDAEVEAAARAVGAHDVIAALPGGYHQELAERGRSLSAGERQLIALARAELIDPALLLLDEATSNLDLVTEARVSAAMQHLARDRTTILIAHRLQTARSADRIAVLEHGRIVEVGSHDELLAARGRYAAMWAAFELVTARHS